MTNHTKIGTCPHCGAPVWARKRAQGDNESTDGLKPPKAEYSCNCRLVSLPTYVPLTTPHPYQSYPWWQWYPYQIWGSGTVTTDSPNEWEYTVSSTTGKGEYMTLPGPTDGTAAIYATN